MRYFNRMAVLHHERKGKLRSLVQWKQSLVVCEGGTEIEKGKMSAWVGCLLYTKWVVGRALYLSLILRKFLGGKQNTSDP